MLKFEVGKTYIMYAIGSSIHFRAKCVSRTAKTPTFNASDVGCRCFAPTFTLRASKESGLMMFDDKPMEVMTTKKSGLRVRYGLIAYACDEAIKPLD